MVAIEEVTLVALPKARNEPRIRQDDVVLVHEELVAAASRDYEPVLSYQTPLVGGDRVQATCDEDTKRCSLCEQKDSRTVTLQYTPSDDPQLTTTEVVYCEACNEDVVAALDEYIEEHAEQLLTEAIFD